MNARDAIRAALDSADHMLLALVGDLKGEDLLVRTTETGGNHALWTLGHLVLSESWVVRKMIYGREVALPEGWAEKFRPGTQPTASAADYPPLEQLLAKQKEVRAATLATMDSLSEAELDEAVPEEFFGTKGRALAFLAGHQTFHTGQLAVVRRRLGRKPLMM